MLQGSLENFALDEVLGLLAGTSKTGKLEIAGNRGTGVLSFNGGHLVDATASYTANGSGLEDVMFELLRYSDGTFSFNAGEVPLGDGAENVATVLAAAESRLRDWRSIEAVVPSLKHQVAPCTELPAEEVTISRAEWSALRVIASGCPVSAVCDKLELGEVEGSRYIKNLAERELVTVIEPIGGYVPPSASTAATSTTLSTTSSTTTNGASANGTVTPPAPLAASPAPAALATTDSAPGDAATVSSLSAQPPAPLPAPVPAIKADPISSDPFSADAAPDSGVTAVDRPPMPPAPGTDELAEFGSADVPPAPPSPAEISSFGDEVQDASELTEPEEQKGGGLLARYLKSDD